MVFDPLIINPAELRHVIQIQAPNMSVRDAAGNPVTNWATILTARAKIEGTGGTAYKMTFADNALAAQSTDLITIRWPGDAVTIKPGQRVVFGNNLYSIQAVDNVQHRNRKVLLATAMMDEDSN